MAAGFPDAGQRDAIAVSFLVGGAGSCVLCLVGWALFAVVPRARSHPATLLQGKLLYDTVLALANVYIYVVALSTGHESNPHCQIFSAIYQFCYHASNTWFLVFAADLFRVTRNPFGVRGRLDLQYHLLAGLLSAVLVALAFYFRAGLYATSANQLCWLEHRPSNVDVQGSRELMIYFFPFHLILACVLALAIMAGVYRSFRRGFPQTHETRSRVISQIWTYLVIFGAYLLAALTVWIVALRFVSANAPDASWRMSFVHVEAAMLVLQGAVNAFAVFRGSRMTLREVRRGLCCAAAGRAAAAADADADELTSLLPTINFRPEDAGAAARRAGRGARGRPQHGPGGPGAPPAAAGESVDRALRKDIVLGIAFGILEGVKHHRSQARRTRHRIHPPPSAYKEGHFEFKSYYSSCFAELRRAYGVEPQHYAGSFVIPTSEGHQIEELAEQFTEGGSGSFFFFTQDRRYIVKTVRHTERMQIEAMLPRYATYVRDNPDSLLCRFYGLYGIRLSEEQRWFYFVVMNNVFASSGFGGGEMPVHRVYDLKGSSVNRTTLRGKQLPDPRHPVRHTLKDGDVRQPFHIGVLAKAALTSQLVGDAMFLNQLGLMDYSLLVGVHNCTASCTHGPVGGLGPGVCQHGDTVYTFGIIDVCQPWDASKRLELFAKTRLLCRSPAGLSCMPPDDYATRFQSRLRDFFC